MTANCKGSSQWRALRGGTGSATSGCLLCSRQLVLHHSLALLLFSRLGLIFAVPHCVGGGGTSSLESVVAAAVSSSLDSIGVLLAAGVGATTSAAVAAAASAVSLEEDEATTTTSSPSLSSRSVAAVSSVLSSIGSVRAGKMY